MAAKLQQLQVRVSTREKAELRRQAKLAGMSLSRWILSRCLPARRQQFEELVARLDSDAPASCVLAELNDLLTGMTGDELQQVLATAPQTSLVRELENHLAAMIEQAAHRAGVAPPTWIAAIAPLAQPVFASGLQTLRLHLLSHSPPPFRRRNIFVDAALGDRV